MDVSKYERMLQKEPAVVSLAIWIASSSVLKRKRGATGPNTSSLSQDNVFSAQVIIYSTGQEAKVVDH